MPDRTLHFGSTPADSARDHERDPSPLPPGALLDDRYRLDRILGTGGMGTVYEAENVRIGRKVAIKILHPELTRTQVDVERFQREARIAVRLTSPHVVDVLDFGRTSRGDFYLAMELLRGESVAARLAREGRFPPERVVELMKQLLTGLSAAHEAGIVHRDLKPENLWLEPAVGGERLKILDFGIAKVADLPEGAARTQAGLVIGTPEYLSPEQAVGGEIDARSDLYSAGIIAWVLATGRHPFQRTDARELVRAHAFEPVPSPDRALPELAAHAPLMRFVARATEKNPAARAQSAAELLAVLEGREARLRSTPGSSTPAGSSRDAPAQAPGRSFPGRLGPGATLPRAVGATILVTEIVGYEGLAGRLSEDEHARLLLAHDEAVLPAIRAFDGRRVRSMRETLLGAFESPTNAVLCGMAIQDRVARRAAGFEVRVGIHLGESRSEDGDLVGDAVDVALAVRGAADPGDVALSRTVYLAMNRSEVPVEPRPAISVPLREEPMPLYRVERAPGSLPYGGREASRVADNERVARVLSPITDGLASIEEGSAEGRLRALVRVAAAGTALVSLRAVDLAAGAASGALAVVAWIGFRRRPAPAGFERLALRLDRLREWTRLRRPVHRAALTRQMS